MRKEICITFLFGWKIYLLLHPLIHKMDLLRVHLKEDNMVTTYDYRHRKKENSTILSKYVWYLKENHKNHSFEWKVLEWAKCFNPFTGKCRLFLLEKYFIMFNQKDATLNSRDVIFDICPIRLPKTLPSFLPAGVSLGRFSNHRRTFVRTTRKLCRCSVQYLERE